MPSWRKESDGVGLQHKVHTVLSYSYRNQRPHKESEWKNEESKEDNTIEWTYR